MLDKLNQLSVAEVEAQFLKCCGSHAWAAKMAAGRPYQDLDSVRAAASAVWQALPVTDWMEAFSAHPKIGDVSSLRAKYANTKAWASGEQSGVQSADEQVLQGLAAGNKAYEKKFGFIFIVCATGKSAAEMLGLLQARLPNNREQEIRNAAAEQIKITLLRIDKWLGIQPGKQP